jgi:hypothetical protein
VSPPRPRATNGQWPRLEGAEKLTRRSLRGGRACRTEVVTQRSLSGGNRREEDDADHMFTLTQRPILLRTLEVVEIVEKPISNFEASEL